MTPDSLLNSRSFFHSDRYRSRFCIARCYGSRFRIALRIAIFAAGLLSLVPSGDTAPVASGVIVPGGDTSLVPGGVNSPVAQGNRTPGYCASETSGPVVYFSQIYDTKLKQPVSISTNMIAREYVEYLKGRYDYNTPSNYSAGCPIFTSMAQAETSKRDLEAPIRQANRQIVEVDWRYVVDEDLVAASYSHQGEDLAAVVANQRKPSHTYCLSDSAQGTLYTTGPIETGGAPNLSLWYRGFDQLLRQKYSFKGRIECNLGSLPEVRRLVNARIEGARAAGKKIVDTGWKYDATAVATSNPRPAQRDDDAEPVPRPAPPNPSRQASDIALKEVPDSVAYCKKDPALSVVFNCESFGREVYNYRMAHLNEKPEPVASLVASNKLNCAPCIDNVRVGLWISNHGAADHLDNRTINCVTQNVIVTLYKKPEANHLKEFYNEAVATCRK
jgi:hypothetical protein